MTPGPIVAMGGAEFAMRPENEALHDYVLGLADSPTPKICLLPTASGDPQEGISAFYAAMDRRRCEPSAISLFRLVDIGIDLREALLAQDVIYVTGGNMVNLLALWREHGLGEVLVEANANGTVLCGYSAGSMCWFEWGISRGVGRPVATRGLGLIDRSHCVHYSQDPARRQAYLAMVGGGAIPSGVALDDHAAALFREGELVEVVRSRETSRAFEVTRRQGDAGVADERELEARLLEPTEPTAVEPALEEMRAIRRMRAGGGGMRRPLGRR
jgi:dipeptidase E